MVLMKTKIKKYLKELIGFIVVLAIVSNIVSFYRSSDLHVNNTICEDSIEIKLKSKIDANNEYFQIENLYKEHRDIVVDLYHKIKQEYSPSYIELLNKDIDGLNLTEEDVYRFVTCGYHNDEDFHKRPLSKLTKDIAKELQLL